MSKKPESRLQQRVQERLRQEFPGCYVRKIHGNEFQHSGILDLVCCIEGFFVAIEVKMPRGELTQLQRNEMDEIAAARGYAVVGDTPEAIVTGVKAHIISCINDFILDQ